MHKFLEVIAAEVADHFDNAANSWDLDAGDVLIVGRGSTSIILGLYERDSNGETTDREIARVRITTTLSGRPRAAARG